MKLHEVRTLQFRHRGVPRVRREEEAMSDIPIFKAVSDRGLLAIGPQNEAAVRLISEITDGKESVMVYVVAIPKDGTAPKLPAKSDDTERIVGRAVIAVGAAFLDVLLGGGAALQKKPALPAVPAPAPKALVRESHRVRTPRAKKTSAK